LEAAFLHCFWLECCLQTPAALGLLQKAPGKKKELKKKKALFKQMAISPMRCIAHKLSIT